MLSRLRKNDYFCNIKFSDNDKKELMRHEMTLSEQAEILTYRKRTKQKSRQTEKEKKQNIEP